MSARSWSNRRSACPASRFSSGPSSQGPFSLGRSDTSRSLVTTTAWRDGSNLLSRMDRAARESVVTRSTSHTRTARGSALGFCKSSTWGLPERPGSEHPALCSYGCASRLEHLAGSTVWGFRRCRSWETPDGIRRCPRPAPAKHSPRICVRRPSCIHLRWGFGVRSSNSG